MKKTVIFILSVVIALSVCACGGGAKTIETTTTAESQVEYFSENSAIPKPAGLEVGSYDKANNLYLYDLTKDENESIKMIEEYIEQLKASGLKIDKDKDQKLMYYILEEGKPTPIGGVGLVSDPSYGKHQMGVMFVK